MYGRYISGQSGTQPIESLEYHPIIFHVTQANEIVHPVALSFSFRNVDFLG